MLNVPTSPGTGALVGLRTMGEEESTVLCFLGTGADGTTIHVLQLLGGFVKWICSEIIIST